MTQMLQADGYQKDSRARTPDASSREDQQTTSTSETENDQDPKNQRAEPNEADTVPTDSATEDEVDDSDSDETPSTSQVAPDEKAASEPEPEPKAASTPAPTKSEPKPKKPEKKAPANKPKMTVSQENAVRSAKTYLEYSSFSRSGLIEQLEFEGFSTAHATSGVDALNANWKEQAVKKRKTIWISWAFPGAD